MHRPEAEISYGGAQSGLPPQVSQRFAAAQSAAMAERPLYDARYSYAPVPGITSGYLPHGSNYDFLPRGTPLMVKVGDPVWPLPKKQQAEAMGGAAAAAAAERRKAQLASPNLKAGDVVRLCNFQSAELVHYNGVAGDVVSVNHKESYDGHKELSYDVRCILYDTKAWLQAVPPVRAYQNAKQLGIVDVQSDGADEWKDPSDAATRFIDANRGCLLGTPEYQTYKLNRAAAIEGRCGNLDPESLQYKAIQSDTMDTHCYVTLSSVSPANVSPIGPGDHPKAPNAYKGFSHPDFLGASDMIRRMEGGPAAAKRATKKAPITDLALMGCGRPGRVRGREIPGIQGSSHDRPVH